MIRALFESYERGCDMPVVVDLEGNIAEGPGFNVFAVKGGTATTPGGTCLEGITRRTALDLLGELNVKGEVGAVSPDDLRGADEVFVTSTAGGILPVTKIDHEPVGRWRHRPGDREAARPLLGSARGRPRGHPDRLRGLSRRPPAPQAISGSG